MPKTKESFEIKKIQEFLLSSGFQLVEDDYANDYCCVCIDYQKEGETRIVDNDGDILIDLPTNYYAILGWLLEKRMASVFILP